MSEGELRPASAIKAGGDTAVLEAFGPAGPRRRATDFADHDTGALSRFEQDQLAREYAEIERASAALRLGEPQLRPVDPVTPTAAKPRPLWLLISLLWLSTAIVTAGAVAAIATFAG